MNNNNLDTNKTPLSTTIATPLSPLNTASNGITKPVKIFGQSSSTNTSSIAAASTGDGLRGEYYDNIDFTNLKLTRIDPTVNFNFGNGSPNTAIGADTFSIRWTGQVEAKYNENYTFSTTTDDGVRLWVNGQQIINNFRNQSATEVSGNITLEALHPTPSFQIAIAPICHFPKYVTDGFVGTIPVVFVGQGAVANGSTKSF